MELNDLRKLIDDVDDEILKLFIKRMELVKEVAKEKANKNTSIEHKDRESEILERLRKDCPEELLPYFTKFYDCIFTLSKDFQKEIK